MILNNKKILIISPHPDDEIIGCGGLIAHTKKIEAKVSVLYITVGSSRQLVTGSTDFETRKSEIISVSNYGKFDYKILFENKYFVELDTLPQKKLIDLIEDYIDEKKPDLVFLPLGDSYNQDHRATFTASITALRPAPVGVRHMVKNVFVYEEPYNWTLNNSFKPNFYLNTEEVEDEKIKLMKLHLTQDREFPFARSKENLVARMRIRGSECGLKSAEAYQILRGNFE